MAKGVVAGVILFQLLGGVGLFSDPNNVSVSGDLIEYNRAAGRIAASGNASLTYKGRTIESESFLYDYESKNVDFSKMFHVKHSKYDVTARQFIFDYESNTGQATELSARVGRLYLSGESAELSPEGLVLHDAIFTTCDEDDMHYHLESETIYIYPAWGFMVAVNNWLELPFLPIPFWVPSFVYGSQKYSVIATPLPVVGSNRREGNFVRQEFNYFLSPKSSGVIGLGTSEHRGIYLGVIHQSILDKQSMLQTDVHYTHSDGIEGGLTHHWVLHQEEVLQEDVDNPLALFMDKHPATIRLMTEIKDGDFIEDSKVNKAPHIQLIGEDQVFPVWDLKGEWLLGWGDIKEDPYEGKDVSTTMTSASLRARRNFSLYQLSVQGEISYEGYWYERFNNWQRVFLNFSFAFPDQFLHPVFTVRKEIVNSGDSPFDFQRINAITEDEIGLQISEKFFGLEWMFQGDYTLEELEPRQLKFQVGKTFHCWGIDVSWESIHERFNFGVRLF